MKGIAMTFAIEGHVHFDPEDPIYADHFPGHPIVPGSLIVWAFGQVLEKTGVDTGTIRLDQFRFRRFISPGSYRYTIHETEKGLRCTLLDKDNTVAQGVVFR